MKCRKPELLRSFERHLVFGEPLPEAVECDCSWCKAPAPPPVEFVPKRADDSYECHCEDCEDPEPGAST